METLTLAFSRPFSALAVFLLAIMVIVAVATRDASALDAVSFFGECLDQPILFPGGDSCLPPVD